ncbi:MAG: hypothetical protein ACKOET_17820 [Verrucomicrobiota bacterium]
MNRLVLASLVSSVLAPALSAQVITLAGWDFEQEPVVSLSQSGVLAGDFDAAVGTGEVLGSHAAAATAWSSPAGNGSANFLSANNWTIGDHFQFRVSTAGYQGVGFSFDHTSSSTGPRDFKLQYSLNGQSFVDAGSYSVLQNSAVTGGRTAWSSLGDRQPVYSFALDLSGVTALNDQANVFFRLTSAGTVSANGGTIAATGTSRIDNVAITAVAVPEPREYAVLAGAGLAAFAVWRRRSAAR